MAPLCPCLLLCLATHLPIPSSLFTPPRNPISSPHTPFSAGCAAWSMGGRSGPTRNFDGVPLENNMLLGFHRLGPFVQSKTMIIHVFSGPVASHTICLDTNRTAYAWGRNEDGQLGLGDTTNRYNPTPITSITSRIKSGACGPNHTILYTTLGDCYGKLPAHGACATILVSVPVSP